MSPAGAVIEPGARRRLSLRSAVMSLMALTVTSCLVAGPPAARQHVLERYSLERIVTEYLQLFDRLLGHATSR
jgi:hypothetical protein